MQTEAGKVLIVEDDDAIRVLLRSVLGERGYEVHECSDGDDALDAARAQMPDVILLDLGLPGRHGLAVLEELKADATTGEIPVLVVTAWDGGELVARALDCGAVDYVRKPFHVAELGARVDAVARTKARQRELEAMATLDELTGLANRRALDLELDRLIAHGHRSHCSVAVLVVDVDHFKAVNDTHGHPIGDEVLRAVAVRLRRQIRGADLVGRWGGDEFMVVTRDADADGVAILAERLRTAVSAAPIGPVTVTVSVGGAVWGENELASALVQRADTALYEAKAAGRDRVHMAPEPERHLRRVA